MAEYIERKELQAEIIKRLGISDEKHLLPAERTLWSTIADIPAADVAPVVRCRDCDCWNEWDHAGHESLGNFRCSCAYWSVEDGSAFYTAPTDFCSNGQKRMDGAE